MGNSTDRIQRKKNQRRKVLVFRVKEGKKDKTEVRKKYSGRNKNKKYGENSRTAQEREEEVQTIFWNEEEIKKDSELWKYI